MSMCNDAFFCFTSFKNLLKLMAMHVLTRVFSQYLYQVDGSCPLLRVRGYKYKQLFLSQLNSVPMLLLCLAMYFGGCLLIVCCLSFGGVREHLAFFCIGAGCCHLGGTLGAVCLFVCCLSFGGGFENILLFFALVLAVINPRRAYAARVTAVVLCVCLLPLFRQTEH